MTKRTKSEWLSLIEAHASSGQTAAAFCRERGVDAKYFSVRRQELMGESNAGATSFHPVGVSSPQSLGAITVELGDVVVRFPTEIPGVRVAEVIKALRA